jgi:thiamine monophosphate synthase
MEPATGPKPRQERRALPELYLITPQPGADDARFLHELHASLAAHAPGSLLVQFRAHGLEPEHWLALAGEVLRRCRAHDARLLLGAGGLPRATPAQFMRSLRDLGADGLQLPSRMLGEPAWRESWGADSARPLLAASCHDARQLEAAQELGATLATVSPVLPTASHPGAAALGWERLRELCRQSGLPVYALGGLDARHASAARAAGAVGIAAIRGLWLGNALAAHRQRTGCG